MSVENAVVVAKLIRSCLAGGSRDAVLLEDGQTLNIGPGDSSSNIYVELEAFDPFSVYVAVEIAADFATELEKCIELSRTPA